MLCVVIPSVFSDLQRLHRVLDLAFFFSNTCDILQVQNQMFVNVKFAENSRKTFVCVSKGSLPSVTRNAVGGGGLTTVDWTEERWSLRRKFDTMNFR